MIPRLTALAAALRWRPVRPLSLAALLSLDTEYVCFTEIVRGLFSDEADRILSARRDGWTREAVRVEAFCERVKEVYGFPMYEMLDSYAAICNDIPFVRFGWEPESFEAVSDMRLGWLMMMSIAALPYEDEYVAGLRAPMYDELRQALPGFDMPAVLPLLGVAPEDLRRRLDGGPFGALAEFGDWMWANTENVFLDVPESYEGMCIDDWNAETMAGYRESWLKADALMQRVDALAKWLEDAPHSRFVELLEAAVTDTPENGQIKEVQLDAVQDAIQADREEVQLDAGTRGHHSSQAAVI